MKNIHPEFHYQTRELGVQISDTLGEPPDRKRYERVIASLIGEYAKGTVIDDVNMLSFALVDHLVFGDAAGLMAEARRYNEGDADKVMQMVSCSTATTGDALAAVFAADPELARKAIITAYLFKHPKGWKDEDHSLDALQEEEDKANADEDEDESYHGENIEHLFDTRGDGND
ncbi:MAG: hypothetical protein KKF58_02565 [Gammaproteobacteria bacterium]|nr:hypothetical protein [Gammaproteobacteria bacterium]MBU1447172.1 hypothetical protein [Gammaproteobacteria bacterium]